VNIANPWGCAGSSSCGTARTRRKRLEGQGIGGRKSTVFIATIGTPAGDKILLRRPSKPLGGRERPGKGKEYRL